MKNLYLFTLGSALVISMAAFAQSPSPSEPKVLSDGAGAKFRRVENTHGTRYIEIFLAARDGKAGKIVAACYNTMFTSRGIPPSRDTAPQKNVEGLNFGKLKQEFGVLNASLNGPKIWTPDWSEFDAGVEREFNGMLATWVAQLNMGDGAQSVEKTAPYKPNTIGRKSRLGWKKGTQVALLDDSEGNTWILKGFQLGLKPQHDYKTFLTVGASHLVKLPSGWKFRSKTLEQDLIETPENGVATIMSDELFNVYDKTGPGMTNYKP